MQIAIKTGVDDRFAGLSAQSFEGQNMRALPFDSVDELMGLLEDLAMNQTRATASVRLAGGMTTRSKVYQQAFRSKQFGGIMTVKADPFEDEAEVFSRVCAIFNEMGGFGRNKKSPPFYVLFDTREQRDAARRSYGPHCLNCGEDNHLFVNARPGLLIVLGSFTLLLVRVLLMKQRNVGAGGKTDFVSGPVLEQNEMVAIHYLATVDWPTCR